MKDRGRLLNRSCGCLGTVHSGNRPHGGEEFEVMEWVRITRYKTSFPVLFAGDAEAEKQLVQGGVR